MPKKCCVPGCRSNYDGEKERVSVFKFPKDVERKTLWLNKIPRANFVPSNESVVCAKHFSEDFIIRVDSAIRPDGSVLSVKRQVPKLAHDAFPSYFPNCPGYLTFEPPTKRKKPEERRLEAEARDEKAFATWRENDKIKSFSDFVNKCSDHVGTQWIIKKHGDSGIQCVSFYCLKDNPVGSNVTGPMLRSSIRVYDNLHVEVYAEHAVQVPDDKLKWIIGQSSPPTLTLWSQFDCLLSHFAHHEKSNQRDKILFLTNKLYEICCGDMVEENKDEHDNLPQRKILFLVEQLKLCHAKQKRYSCDTLLSAFQIFASSPSTYEFIRTSVLTLPSASHLRKLGSVFNMSSGVTSVNSHESYLEQKCKYLREDERSVVLMMDEIHVANKMSYSGGKMEGAAMNCSLSEANSAQVFMISSYLSKNKDVAAIVPVKNINARSLHDLTVKVVQMLHKIGYFIICIISDNNRINRNCFTIYCGGNLQSYIPHPVDPSEKLFFLFDTVHLFKCIRNNWLSQKDVEKTFLFRSLHGEEMKKASFFHLRKLFTEEKDSVLKLAYGLSSKSLYPNNLEKQNVPLMLKIFNVKNSIALDHYEDQWKLDTSGTREFINTFATLWDILNVKNPQKHARLRKEACRPISSCNDENVQYISRVLNWLNAWNKSPAKPREGSLSKETMFALQHTLKTLLELFSHMLGTKGFKYILTGKFQTDELEFRFSQYRQLSGCNYHISVQQVLEGEKKLKLMSVLHLVSAKKGEISFKSLVGSLQDESMRNDENDDITASKEEYLQFLSCLSTCQRRIPTPAQSKALIFISGYASSKVIPYIDCDMCKTQLILPGKILKVEGNEDSYSYLRALDRGGLTWPSEAVIDIVAMILNIFQALIGDTELEDKFLRCKNQRNIMMQLAFRCLLDRCFDLGQCEGCDANFQDVLKGICKPTINILLNNYSKQFASSEGINQRKLKTLTKRDV